MTKILMTNYDKSGDRKAFVATIVANVATERIWLDTSELDVCFLFMLFLLTDANPFE